ncbi:hypothetical protein FPV67DRAFT_518405 [Lyophyllum atratum]|nr:hypothetical protein FPV67DRAFT_518405 [Lyophyllum atratum]
MDTVAISQDGEREREDKSLSMYMKREELDEVNFFQGNTSRHDPTQVSLQPGGEGQGQALLTNTIQLSQPRVIRQQPFSLGSSVAGPSHDPHAPLDAGRATATTVVSKRGRTLKKSRRAIDGDVEVSGPTSTPRKRKRMQGGKPSTETVDGVEVQEAKHNKKVARPRKTTTLPVSTQPTERLPKVPLEDGLAEEKVVKRRKNTKVPGIVANELADQRESNTMPETGVLQEKEAKVKKRIVKPKLDGGEKVKEVKEAKEPKAKTGVTTRRKKQALANGEPQWSLAKPQPSIQLAVGTSSTSRLDDQPVIQPSIWCGSKEELVSALPELSKSVNGVTWLLSPTPVIFVEDRATNGIIVSDLGGDGISFELKMIRDFVCLSDDLVTLADQTVDKSTTTITTTRGEQQTQIEQLAALSPIRDGCLDSGATGQSELRAPSQGPNTRPIPGSFSNLPPTPILLPPGSKAQDWSTPTRSPDKTERIYFFEHFSEAGAVTWSFSSWNVLGC